MAWCSMDSSVKIIFPLMIRLTLQGLGSMTQRQGVSSSHPSKSQ